MSNPRPASPRSTGLKAEWQPYLHKLRARETEKIFGRCPADAFPQGLELGAGDGFQSTLLARYVQHLISTDYRPQITRQPQAGEDGGRVTYMTCDAERVDEAFAACQFDLVFSSNLLEHLPRPHAALRGIAAVLADDGIAIHVIPSPFWKLSQLIGFYPNAVLARADRLAHRGRAAADISGGAIPATQGADQADAWDNNPKVATRPRPYLARLLWPAAHGASGSNRAEFHLFSRAHWLEQFAAAGFRVVSTLRGPVSSGYGFGWDTARSALERLGLSSETVYVTVKASAPPSARQAQRLSFFAERTA